MSGLTGHYLSPDRMFVYGVVNGRALSRYQVSALLQNGKMPKLATPGSTLGFIPSETNDAVKWIRRLEENGKILSTDELSAALAEKP